MHVTSEVGRGNPFSPSDDLTRHLARSIRKLPCKTEISNLEDARL